MARLTTSGTLIIPVLMRETDPISSIFSQVNLYLKESLED
jgi:hypothetical protein